MPKWIFQKISGDQGSYYKTKILATHILESLWSQATLKLFLRALKGIMFAFCALSRFMRHLQRGIYDPRVRLFVMKSRSCAFELRPHYLQGSKFSRYCTLLVSMSLMFCSDMGYPKLVKLLTENHHSQRNYFYSVY